MPKQHLLIVDDDSTYLSMLSDTFSDYQISTAQSGTDAITVAQNSGADVIILDVVMPDMDGYTVCKAIRNIQKTASTPIVFYSSMDTLEGRLKAYDFGGNDYISKSCSIKEMKAKILSLLNSEKEHIAIREELTTGRHLLQNMQNETSALHVISLFSQACQFCFDYETLSTVLFNSLFSLNLRGVIYFKESKKFFSSNGSHTRLEEEILSHTETFDRIFSFGESRVIFNWESCALLAKDVGDQLDSLAQLMGAVQTGIFKINMHIAMMERMLALETHYKHLKSQLALPSSKLKQQLIEAGLISNFDIQDQKDLDEILESYGNDWSSLFDESDHSVNQIHKILERIRVPPPELKSLFEKKKIFGLIPDDCEDILF